MNLPFVVFLKVSKIREQYFKRKTLELVITPSSQFLLPSIDFRLNFRGKLDARMIFKTEDCNQKRAIIV